METETLIGRIEQVRNDPEKLSNLQAQLQVQIESLTETIKTRLKTETVSSLLLDLTRREVARVSDPSGMAISDFAGQSRFLRAICAAVPLETFDPSADPQTDELFRLCDAAWRCLSFREILEGLKTHAVDCWDPRVMFAGMMSLITAIQGDLMSDEDCNQRVRRLFGQFSANVIVPQLGVDIEEVIGGFTGVRETLKTRMERVFDLMRPMMKMRQEFNDLVGSRSEPPTVEEYAKQNPTMKDAFEQFSQGVEIDRSLLIYQPSDLDEYVNGKGREFLEAFSFTPGTVNQDLTTLFDDDVVRRCPFGRLSGHKYVLFNALHCAFAPLHRLPGCFTTEIQRQKLLKNRDNSLEQEAIRLFSGVCEPDQQFTEYYLPLGPNGELHERDLLIIRGDVALIIESKAQAMRSVSGHRGNVRKIEKDVKGSIEKGYRQAISVIRYLRDATGPVAVYGSDKTGGSAIGSIDPASLNTFIPVVFLDSYFGLISTNLEPWLEPTETEGYPWVVDSDAMTAIVSLIKTHAQLIRFIEWRRQLHGVAVNEDETVFAGFFLRHGPAEMPQGADLVQLDPSYSEIFDNEYLRRMGGEVDEAEIFVGPPTWSAMEREGADIKFSLNGKLVDSINLHTGHSHKSRRRQPETRRGKIGRNASCPYGSGKKYKKCCGAK